MTEEDKIELERLLDLKIVIQQDKVIALRIYQEYVGIRNFCLSCNGQVVILFKELKKYYNKL